ncbi:dual OB domain-containing protein [Halodesulfovibrio spirochaetisodalis]|uniref:Dual OB-containing domain-containing protein n=1 Tax=Halodesulfovibrio spirochaetisodalis TaxID=1560234 RepID=A0A1B7XI34_9BACT|nr:hypothetical protein [Halodesulfovibrio spirochaetisodalis]OBQ55190.1 hypothetical protein SP90_04275 [Halodesulfovibrio spirochaetisodalis]
MPVKNLVILANSYKHQGRCVAGKDINTHEWVRAVSDAQGAEVMLDRCTYENIGGTQQLRTKKVLSIDFSVASPLAHQPENYIVTDVPWVQSPPYIRNDLTPYLDSPVDLWGVSNFVPFQDILNSQVTIGQSLYLVQVTNLRLYVNTFDRLRCEFSYSANIYDLPATDPWFNSLMNQGRSGDAILCVSLGEPYQGNCYKIVASIF